MSWQLRLYLAVSHLLPLVAPTLLKRRLAKGKENPERWREKMGVPSVARPDGPLVWMHAVGLGEVLALRGLIREMQEVQPDLNFLITSSARSSAEVMAKQLPPNTQHQLLPLDAPPYLKRFLEYWQPGLSIWAEQDLWPGAVALAHKRGVPLALVNARMNAAAFKRRARAKGLYGALLHFFRLVSAQESVTADHLIQLGARGVKITGSLKSAAPPLEADPEALEALRLALEGRMPWCLASSHPADEALALQAQLTIFEHDRTRLLLIAPRDPHRADKIEAEAKALGLTVARRSRGEGPGRAAVWIADTFGEMGLWYRLCPVTVIGGTFDEIEGHNPWEPAILGSAVLHGPRVANFAADFAELDREGAALPVTADTLAGALLTDHTAMAARAQEICEAAQGSLRPLAQELLTLVR